MLVEKLPHGVVCIHIRTRIPGHGHITSTQSSFRTCDAGIQAVVMSGPCMTHAVDGAKRDRGTIEALVKRDADGSAILVCDDRMIITAVYGLPFLNVVWNRPARPLIYFDFT